MFFLFRLVFKHLSWSVLTLLPVISILILQAVHHIRTLPLFMMLLLLKCPSHSVRLLAAYLSSTAYFQYIVSIVSNLQLFSLPVALWAWELFCLLYLLIFLGLTLHPVINFLWSKILYCLSEVTSANADCLHVTHVHGVFAGLTVAHFLCSYPDLTKGSIWAILASVSPVSSTAALVIGSVSLNCWGEYLKSLVVRSLYFSFKGISSWFSS